MNEQSEETAEKGQQSLPKSVRRLQIDDQEIYLVGTAHVSHESVQDVRETIETIKPDTVCVELDQGRYKNLTDQDRWKKTNIGEVIRKGKAMLLLSALIMTSFQPRIGKKLGITPGAELLEATKVADQVGASLVLADRDIQVTLKRSWGNLGFGQRLKMASQLVASIFMTEEVSEETVEELKQDEKLADVLQLFADEFPALKVPLIDERDVYLAQKIRSADGKLKVAVVGAGHVPGILEAVKRDIPLEPLESLPRPSRLSNTTQWAIPALILSLLIFGFFRGGVEHSLESIYIWFLINGLLSAAGATLAMGHPLTILSALLAAPLTSLNPFIAAGWVSGLVQAFVRKPKVQDLEDLPEAITSVKGFWLNPVSRILLVVVFSNLGSVAGTFIAGSWIAARVLA
jgi:pheromone shutdown-related protein TraB